jgi:hypothetical protein
MRCFFHLTNNHEVIRDDDGVEALSVETVRRLALQAVHELQQESDHVSEEWHGWQLVVVDSSGTVLLSIPLDMSLQ